MGRVKQKISCPNVFTSDNKNYLILWSLDRELKRYLILFYISLQLPNTCSFAFIKIFYIFYKLDIGFLILNYYILEGKNKLVIIFGIYVSHDYLYYDYLEIWCDHRRINN